MSKVLQDYTKQGKPRKWGVRKSQSRKYANRLYTLSDVYDSPTLKKAAGRVWSCGDILEFGKSLNGRKVLIHAQFCHDRFCALCQWRRMLKMSYQTTKTIQQALLGCPTSRFIFLTLTVKNCKGTELKQTVSTLNQAARKLLMYKQVKKNVIGWVKSIEVTVNRDDDTYHPHIHILLQLASTYFKNKGEYMTHKDWQILWAKALKVSYGPMVSFDAVKSRNRKDSINASVSEIAKYQTKATQYLSLDVDQDVKIIDTLRTQLRGNRMISYGGLLKDVHNKLFKHEDENTEDLVSISGNEELDEKAGTIIAQWNSHFQNYVITETGNSLSIGRKD